MPRITGNLASLWLRLTMAAKRDPDRTTSLIVLGGLIGALVVACTR